MMRGGTEERRRPTGGLPIGQPGRAITAAIAVLTLTAPIALLVGTAVPGTATIHDEDCSDLPDLAHAGESPEASIPVLLGGFRDTSPTYEASDFEEAFFGSNPTNVKGPGSAAEYWAEATDGELVPNAGPDGVNGWYETRIHSDNIEAGNQSNTDFKFFRSVVRQADADVDFSQYANWRGCVAVTVVYQGHDQSLRAHASDTGSSFFLNPKRSITVDGVEISAYVRLPELNGSGAGRETVGTFAHEMGHLLGLPDLYDEDGGPDVGPWGLMASGSWGKAGGPPGSSPVHLSAWSKLALFERYWGGEMADHVVTIEPAGQPGILPPAATHHQYYRIDPVDRPGCTPCEEEYYLLGYRERVGFDEGLSRWVGGDRLKIYRIQSVDDRWEMSHERIGHVARLGDTNRTPFNADVAPLANLTDDTDSGIDLRGFNTTYGYATFNDPPKRHLEKGQKAVFAVAVGMTLPDGTQVDADRALDARVAAPGDTEIHVLLCETGCPTEDNVLYAGDTGYASYQGDVWTTGQGEGFARAYFGPGPSTYDHAGTYKLVHQLTDDDVNATDYISATNHPVFPLPTDVEVTVTEPWDDYEGEGSTVTFQVNVTSGGQPYTYGQFGAPDASHFNISIGGSYVPAEEITLTEQAEHLYTIKVPVPVDEMIGYDLSVAFTDRKLKIPGQGAGKPGAVGVSHTARGSANILDPVLEEMRGEGSAWSPYVITDAKELQAMSADLEADYVLGNDIDASGTSDWFGGEGFAPVGIYVVSQERLGNAIRTDVRIEPFNGSLEGRGYTISDLTIDRGDEIDVGLFRELGPGSRVEDVGLVSLRINGSSAGGLAGHADGTIHGSFTTGTVEGTGGGLVGTLQGNEGPGYVSDSYSTAQVEGVGTTGGLVGSSRQATIERSFARGSVTGGEYVGGLVGDAHDTTIRDSYARGAVEGQRIVGGLVGYLQEIASHPKTSEIVRSYAAGPVDGPSATTGGLIGAHDDGFEDTQGAYWDRERTGQDGFAGDEWSADTPPDGRLQTPQMQGTAAEEHMTSLDFDTVWRTGEGPGGYPELQWYDADTYVSGGSNAAAGGASASQEDQSEGQANGTPGLGISIVAACLGAVALARGGRRHR